MSTDSLPLLLILKQELSSMANDLQKPIIEDIMTDNGIIDDDDENNDNNHDDEKAPELIQLNSNKSNNDNKTDKIGAKLEELIKNYLTPSIKQLSKKQNKNRKKKQINNNNLMQSNVFSNEYLNTPNPASLSQSQSVSPPLSLSNSPPSHHQNIHNSQYLEPPYNNRQKNGFYPNNPHHQQPPPQQHLIPEPGGKRDSYDIDSIANGTEKVAHCCRRFITSLFCGCGMFQIIGFFLILGMSMVIFVFYNVSELKLILKEVNRWKELNLQVIQSELEAQQKLAQIGFDLDVDLDKLTQEHQHRENMEIIDAKKKLTQDFIEKNTRTVTTTYWNFLTTETETVSQTIFSEDDIAFFQNNILYYGFNSDKAIGSGETTQQSNNPNSPKLSSSQNNMSESDNNNDHNDVSTTCNEDDDSFDQL